VHKLSKIKEYARIVYNALWPGVGE